MGLKILRNPGRTTHAVNAEPNVIPFIDVMLVLLIIFMVAAPKPSTDLQVNLPAGPQLPASVLDLRATTVRVGAWGDFFIEGEAVSPAQFRTRLLSIALARNPNLSGDLVHLFGEAEIRLSADQAVSYDTVFAAVEEIGAAGFHKVHLIVGDADA